MKQLVITNKLTNRETDSFNQYLKEIAGIPLLTPEEELICAKKARLGDKLAKEELITKNLRFVISVAKQHATFLNPLEDLVNEGNIGLIKAAERFNPDEGWRFLSYGVWWIRKALYEYLSNYGKLVRIPHNKINSLSKLEKKLHEMEQTQGRSIDMDELISEAMDLIPDGLAKDAEDKAIEKVKSEYGLLNTLTSYSVDSLDREIGSEDSNLTLADLIVVEDSYKNTDHLMTDGNTKSEIQALLNTLNPRRKRIMIGVFGLDGNTPMSLNELGEELGVSREMIRQEKEKSLLLLKKKMTVRNH
jgi:RNA polymerase primary sigma factor